MAGPQKKVFRKIWDENAETITLSTDDKDAKVFDARELDSTIQTKLMLHGLTQKLSDATAKQAGSFSTAEKWDAINDVWAALLAGEWSLKREGQGTILLRALCELYPSRTREQVKVWLDGKTPAEKTALGRNPNVKKIVDRMQSEKASDIDTDSLLDELE